MKNKLNIALVIDSFYPSVDGVIKVVESYINGLGDKCNITLITSRPRNEKDVKKSYKNLKCKVLFCNSLSFNFDQYAVPNPKFDFEFKKVLKNAEFDLIHLHSLFPLGLFMYKYAKENKIPVIATAHSKLYPDIKNYIKFKLASNLIFDNYINIFNNMDCVFSLNTKMEEYLKQNGFKGKSIIMPNASHFVLLKPLSECKKSGSKLLNIKKEDNVLLFVGRLIEGKGIFLILDALKKLNELNIDFKMFYVGMGEDEKKLKEKIKEYKLDKKVKLLGKISKTDKLEKIYAAANLFLFPSNYDTDGIVKREAACCSVPGIFLKDSCAGCEIIDNFNGFLCENNSDSLANKIKTLLKDKPHLKEIGKNAKKTIYCTWDKNLKEVFKIYKQIVNNNKTKTSKWCFLFRKNI